MKHLYTADEANPDYCMYCGGSDAADGVHFDIPDTVEEALQILKDMESYRSDVFEWVTARVGMMREPSFEDWAKKVGVIVVPPESVALHD